MSANNPCFNFVLPSCSDDDLALFRSLDVDEHWYHFVDGVFCWILQTYLIMRARLESVRLSSLCSPDAINLVHAVDLPKVQTSPDIFVVALRADYRRCSWAHLHVVQNQVQLEKTDSVFIPHWPQPGLIPRRQDRGTVANVAFAGRGYYLAGQMRQWREDMSARGLSFYYLDKNRWNDFSEVDILLAIRSFDGQSYDNKPPSKLINAWLAGVPLIAGNDSAFRQIGSPGEDYIVATSYPDALQAIERLRSDSSFYERLVANGRARGYNRERIAKVWEAFLTQEALLKFREWQKRGFSTRVVWRVKRLAEKMSFNVRRRMKQLVHYQAPWARRR